MRISDWSSDVCSSDLIPTVLTLKGLGALPAAHPLHLGMLGMHGSRAANMAVQESDLLVVVGARFDDRATGKLAEFAPLAEVIHLDLDAAEVGKLRHAHAGVVGDVAARLRALAGVIPDDTATQRAANQHCARRKHTHAEQYGAACGAG